MLVVKANHFLKGQKVYRADIILKNTQIHAHKQRVHKHILFQINLFKKLLIDYPQSFTDIIFSLLTPLPQDVWFQIYPIHSRNDKGQTRAKLFHL